MNNKIELAEKIIFIASMEDLESSISNSTHIMTRNMLEGLKANGENVVFIALVDSGNNKDKIREYFSTIASNILCIDSFFGHDLGRFQRMFTLLFSCINRKKQRKTLLDFLSQCVGTPKMVICHYPSLETTIYGDLLKKKYKQVKYYLYGSDPIALSGITPEQYGFKRFPFYLCEKNSYKKPDRIIFGTQPLMSFQQQLYKKYAIKMRYIDVAGPNSNQSASKEKMNANHLLYSGNYYREIRNIEPLIAAIAETDYILDIYGSGDIVPYAPNINVYGRIPAEEIKKVENKYSTIVCLLNHSCIQIPGKIFYSMMTDAKIVVILDGPYKSVLRNYLNKFKRFIICENDKNSIIQAIKRINDFSLDWNYIERHYSNKEVAFDLVQGGLT